MYVTSGRLRKRINTGYLLAVILLNEMFLKIFFTLLLQGVFNTQASESYCVSDKLTTWTSASETHTLAIPDIIYNKRKPSINIDLHLDNKQVWIGYFKALTAFEYFGCINKDDFNSSKTFTLTSNEPGLCFSACGKQMLVGLRRDKCYCSEHEYIVNNHLPYCDETCEASDKAFLCGGDKYISLYKVNKEATVSKQISEKNTNDSKCLHLDNNDGSQTIGWRSCKAYLKAMCTFANSTILSNGNSFEWKNATQRCFQLNGYATRYINTTFNFHELPGGTSWTGVIRSSVIYKYDEIDSGGFSKIECGYTKLSRSNSKEVLFTDKCNNDYMNVLCIYETTSAITLTPSSTYSTTYKIDSGDGGSTTERITSSTIISTGTEPAVTEEQKEDPRGSDVSAVIVASVVSVLAVVAVGVVVVVLKRRNKLPFFCKEAIPERKSGYQQSKRTTDEMSLENHDYDQANVGTDNTVNINSDSNYAHTYFVLEQHVNESNTDNTTYDTSGNANKTITEPDNVYNRLKTDNNQTYDHAHTKIRNGVLKFDDTYDTTDKAAMKLKARPGKDSDAFGETDEDAYNHITSKTVTNSKTENEYGVPNTLENAYGDVGANNKNNTHDEGDTYSHINNKPQNKGKQGNPFSESKQMRISKLSEGNQDEDYAVTGGDDKLLTTDNDYSTIGTVH